ncbi:low molecular weight phosphatase family protein [Rhodococcus rhodnii]|uniref:Protein-tyrosine-phosphatase n=2 Tax=Rhodococcus rhodnii TaxID=38312 RepID=R7WPN6_9NOCA|nr:protein-tyrosine-phosphatase [Rhodococcus rhodnii]EOM75959.1 protein-tyrosine-phosphatase [Rhodococcus rhodnii LMG 5362]TXG90128.1 low molecular weight phosphatase family protein [Rhodococcus rhodnii]
MRVLFVCTGNICRSPSAERLLLAYARAEGIDLSGRVSSAGVRAVIGSAMEPTAADVLTRLGGDPSGFTARMFTPALARDADLVLTMTERQRDRVLAEAPRAMRRTFTFVEAARLVAATGASDVATLAAARTTHRATASPEDVQDPMGREPAVFERVGAELADLTTRILPLLRAV